MGPLAEASKATPKNSQQVLTALIAQLKSCNDPPTKTALKQKLAALAKGLYHETGTAQGFLEAIDALAGDTFAECTDGSASPDPQAGSGGLLSSKRIHADHPKRTPFAEVKMLRLKEVLEIVPCSPSSWWAWVAAGKAPAPIRLGKRTTCWRYQDVAEFAAGRWVA